MGLPIFVKPAANGSSFGVTRVTSKDQLLQAIADAGVQGDRVLIEECVVGTEITVPVIGNDHPTALPIVEIVFALEDCCIEGKTVRKHDTALLDEPFSLKGEAVIARFI